MVVKAARGESCFLGNARNIAFWVVLFLLIVALFNLFSGAQSPTASRTVSYSDFIQRVDQGEVQSVTLDGERVLVRAKDGSQRVLGNRPRTQNRPPTVRPQHNDG